MIARLGIAARLALASGLLLVVAGLVIQWVSSAHVERVMIDRTRVELSSKLRLLEDAARGVGRSSARGPAEWGALARTLDDHAGGRVTLIAPDGAVVADSRPPAGDAFAFDNHASREEIAAALAHGEGAAIRISPTLHVRMIYAARRYPDPDHGVAVIRLAVPLSDVDAAIASSRRLLGAWTALAVALAVIAGVVGAHRLTRPIRDLTRTALTMAGGDLDVRAGSGGTDEVARLGSALDGLAGALSRSISDLTADRDLLSAILEGMADGVLVVDRERRVVLANGALRRMIHAGGDVAGKAVGEVVAGDELDRLLDEAARGGEAVTREIDLDGLVTSRVLVRASRLASADPKGVLAVLHDVTHLRRLEKIRSDFVANVSHELRTPITAIATSVETLLEGALDDPGDAREFVRVIERHSARLRQLVDDLLDLSRLETRGFRLSLVDADLAPIAAQVVALMEEPARRRQVSLSLDAGSGGAARVDRRAIEQILSNLLDNAIKYAGEGARASVSIRTTEGGVTLTVSDDGPGIPRQHLDRIFERFYRVDAGRSRDVGGTGLGLSIVKHLVDLMRGTVSVESEPGHGASFIVRLPAPPAETASSEPLAAE